MRRYTRQVNFSGGHDDTMAELTAVVQGRAPGCEAGSKTRLMGEDGDVNLQCRVTAAAGANRALVVIFKWNHAQYEGYSLTER